MNKHVVTVGQSDIYVGEAHKFYRDVVLGISQADMAAITNVSQSLLSAHERGLYSETASDAYREIGFYRFWSNVEWGYATLEDILSGKLAKRLHDYYPTEVPYKQGRYEKGEKV